MAEFKEFGFYTVEADYLEYLNRKDSEVYYNNTYRTAIKPFVGVVIVINAFHYFIPLTSAKEKHIKWKNVSDEHFIVYELVKSTELKSGNVYKNYSEEEKIHILSLLDLKKMIPVPEDSYQKIDFNELEDTRYRDLFRKEYAFCLGIKEKIIKKVDKIYAKQKKDGVVRRAYCNFALCEKALDEWEKK